MLFKPVKKYFSSVIWWSVISAAFIGPGTVTTAAKAGADFGSALLWTIVFATIACYVLQEGVARLTIISNRSLGENISTVFRNPIYSYITGFAIFLGCMAYEAGNILGAVEGLKMIWPGTKYLFITAIGLISIIVLISGNLRIVTSLLGAIVAIMGVCFVVIAVSLSSGSSFEWKHLLQPTLPDRSEMIVIGLIGTTIVPYNLFLGSGMGKNQELKNMRLGLFTSVFVGGIITGSILITGSFIYGSFSFDTLKQTISNSAGSGVSNLIGIGLFCAGLSSAITAPLAAAFTAQSLFEKNSVHWRNRGIYFKATWGMVLIVGIIFSFLDYQPVPVIISAQILNGLILPFIVFSILIAINSKKCVGLQRNKLIHNLLIILVLIICLILGVKSLHSFFS